MCGAPGQPLPSPPPPTLAVGMHPGPPQAPPRGDHTMGGGASGLRTAIMYVIYGLYGIDRIYRLYGIYMGYMGYIGCMG